MSTASLPPDDAMMPTAEELIPPVPRVTIDFGDGQRLERTLHGNVAFWFTTADGGAFDLLPGLPTRAVLFERCHQALDLHRRLAAAVDGRQFAGAALDVFDTAYQYSTDTHLDLRRRVAANAS